MASTHFGLRARATPLYAERDRNFRLDCDDGRRFVLKVANADSAPETIDFQVRALEHLQEADPDLPVPGLRYANDGQPVLEWQGEDGTRLFVRVYGWLEGNCLDLAAAPAPTRRSTGKCLARLGLALANCNSRGAPGNLPWDLLNFGRLRGLSGFLAGSPLQRMAEERLERFRSHWRANLLEGPQQVIHNDFNPGNLLFDDGKPPRLCGVIDFGDMVEGPVICDLAVGASYQLSGDGNAVDELLPLLSGFHGVRPLGMEELELLLPLVECRLLTTLLVQGNRCVARGEDWSDRSRSCGQAAHVLLALGATDPAEIVDGLAEALY